MQKYRQSESGSYQNNYMWKSGGHRTEPTPAQTPTFRRQFNSNHLINGAANEGKSQFKEKNRIIPSFHKQDGPHRIPVRSTCSIASHIEALGQILYRFQQMQEQLRISKETQIRAFLDRINGCHCHRSRQEMQTSFPINRQSSEFILTKTPIKITHNSQKNQDSKENLQKTKTVKSLKNGVPRGSEREFKSFRQLIDVKLKKSIISSIDLREQSFETVEKEAFRELFPL